jgi:hypothetical protein
MMLDIELPLICNVTLIEVSIELNPITSYLNLFSRVRIDSNSRSRDPINLFSKQDYREIFTKSVERRLSIKLITKTFPTTKNNSDEATDVITGVGGKTYLVIKHPCTKIATIIDKTTNEKEFVIAKEFHAKPIILDDGRQ